LSVTHVPNVMQIRQCFLELQLKMSGMFFFETHCTALLRTRRSFYYEYGIEAYLYLTIIQFCAVTCILRAWTLLG